ncbi:hypothetical protein GYB62_01610, partial [bacterium]|nr:hypothetical protein [bacterium]
MTQQVVIHNIAAAMETLGGIAEHIPADIADVGEFVAARLAAGRTLDC